MVRENQPASLPRGAKAAARTPVIHTWIPSPAISRKSASRRDSSRCATTSSSRRIAGRESLGHRPGARPAQSRSTPLSAHRSTPAGSGRPVSSSQPARSERWGPDRVRPARKSVSRPFRRARNSESSVQTSSRTRPGDSRPRSRDALASAPSTASPQAENGLPSGPGVPRDSIERRGPVCGEARAVLGHAQLERRDPVRIGALLPEKEIPAPHRLGVARGRAGVVRVKRRGQAVQESAPRLRRIGP